MRIGLPAPGELGEQDARDLEAMTVLREWWTRAIQEHLARRRKADELAAWRARRANERRGQGAHVIETVEVD